MNKHLLDLTYQGMRKKKRGVSVVVYGTYAFFYIFRNKTPTSTVIETADDR